MTEGQEEGRTRWHIYTSHMMRYADQYRTEIAIRQSQCILFPSPPFSFFSSLLDHLCITGMGGGGEGSKKKSAQTKREREKDTHTHPHPHTHTHTHTGKERERQTDRQTDRQRGGGGDFCIDLFPFSLTSPHSSDKRPTQ